MMSLSRRSSLSPPKPVESTHDLKQRVITSLNKLSDRDTVAVGTNELDFIAKNLTDELFSTFLTCLHTTDSSEKSPVRKQCVRILAVLSETHGAALSPHVVKMIAIVVRRLRDPDSSVRLACVDVIRVMSSRIREVPFTMFLKSFMDVILIEQDYNLQIGSALCLAAAIEAAEDLEPARLSKYVSRLLKLAKSDCFKAKSALLSLICSIVASGGASSRAALDGLIPCVIEFLSNEDWAARKAAAEVLGKVAALDSVLVAGYAQTCLTSLESRRFDKVKNARDTMNSALDSWKNISDASADVLVSPSQSISSVREKGDESCYTPVSKQFHNVDTKTIQSKKATPTSRSTPSTSSSSSCSSSSDGKKRIPLKTTNKKQLDGCLDRKTEVVMSGYSTQIVSENDYVKKESLVSDPTKNEDNRTSKQETKRALFSKICEGKMHRFGNVRYGSRVVPILEMGNSELATARVSGDHKDIEDLNLIHKQLVQIENQQSNLFDTLQRFMGSSQNGMNLLETRVNGLEMALEEISYDLSLSVGRVSNTESNPCCKLPGTEFLTPKFWRRTEGQYSTSRFPSTAGIRSPSYYLPDNKNNQMVQNRNMDICSNSGANLEFPVRRINRGAYRANARDNCKLYGSASTGTCRTSVNLSKRLST